MYKHGIEVEEKKTTYQRPLATSYGVQVVVGTAPVNLTKNPKEYVNRPVLVQSFAEAVEKLGYTDDWSYTLCQSIYASFQMFHVYPVIYVNVLDPDKHSKDAAEASYTVKNHQVALEKNGILLSSIQIKAQTEGEALKLNEDYVLSFDSKGKSVITLLSTGAGYALETIRVSHKYLDPSMVTEEDIIGAYDVETGKETGLELVRRVYPMFHLSPGLILAPGWSQKPNVGAAIQEKCTEINGVFRCECVLDLDTATTRKYSECGTVKKQNGYTDPHAIVLWPELLTGGKHMAFSAAYGAMASYYTATNGDVPYLYPSNRLLNVEGAVLADGTEITLDQTQAAYLNGDGVVTAINDGGWRSWGNNTGCYPENTDPKDYRIACRRMFSFVANYFIRQYQSRLDASMNRRTIDDIVNSFNIWGNSLVSQGMCAGLRMEYDESENDNESLLNGHVKVKIYLAPYTPLEYILASEEFDMTALQASIVGREE
ncbi:phage tail sheath family protein [[Clostridium] symbiosum]|uniref:phage tail sheath family protein n=2 Tax=Clostridium symbiosum TaxID=1512 RepID=UPI0034A316E2